eukprot:scaffold15514_cov129-Cylindrotheca_fusiformis.AAC.6
MSRLLLLQLVDWQTTTLNFDATCEFSNASSLPSSSNAQRDVAFFVVLCGRYISSSNAVARQKQKRQNWISKHISLVLIVPVE